MLTQEELFDLKPILQAQSALVRKLEKAAGNFEASFSTNEETAGQIAFCENLLDEMNLDIETISLEDAKHIIFTLDEVRKLYEGNCNSIHHDLLRIDFKTWDQFTASCIRVAWFENLDPFAVYESLLSEESLKHLRKDEYAESLKWDQLDYLFVGLAGVLAAVTDFLIVGIPKGLAAGAYKGQEGSTFTKWLQSLKLPDSWQEWLESRAKVPYDRTGGADHRIDSIGHDPIFGLIFGIIDLIRGTSTSIKDGMVFIAKVGSGVDPLEAILRQFLHLLSDVATKKGLPIPFASVVKLLNVGSFSRANGKTATISQLMTWMYHNGYDLRHFLTMSVTPATIELILRMYILIRHYIEKDEEDYNVAESPKYRSMMLAAHAISCAANAGKVAIHQGNPLAINAVEWMMLIRYLIPHVKYWIFEKDENALIFLQDSNEKRWDELMEGSTILLKKIRFAEMDTVVLNES